jgi:hypothetical protein
VQPWVLTFFPPLPVYDGPAATANSAALPFAATARRSDLLGSGWPSTNDTGIQRRAQPVRCNSGLDGDDASTLNPWSTSADAARYHYRSISRLPLSR